MVNRDVTRLSVGLAVEGAGPAARGRVAVAANLNVIAITTEHELTRS